MLNGAAVLDRGVPQLSKLGKSVLVIHRKDGHCTVMLKLNTQAPEFILPNIKGEKVSLSSQKGKWIVLVFYRGSWCPMCNTQIANLASDYPKFQEVNAEIIAISTDIPEKAVKTQKKSHSLFPILLDEKGKVVQLYGVLVEKRERKDVPAFMHGKKAGTYAMPAVFIIDSQGVLRYSYVGKSFTDRPSNEDLLKTLKELQ